uniref:SRCR domain-containing protein n=1 Tax=Erpetoichthys calabaricus TaxID=27687 RepID=A0A8C4X2T2_ERPCA
MGCYFFVIKAEHFSNCIWLLAVELRWLVLIGSWSQFCTSYFCFPDHLDLRLTNGTSVCDGRLEIFYNGSWGTVCDDSWDLPDANVVCRQLQCEAAVEAITPVSYGPGSGHIWLDDVHCQGNESSLSICTHRGWGQNDCRHKEDVGVNCTGRLIILVVNLRLVGGTNNCSGRVEIKYGDTWGTVCDDDWDMKDVKVVCQQLRCGEPVSAELEFGGGRGVIWLNKVRCRGTEAHLWDCQHEPLGKNDCEHKEDAGVNCTGEKDYAKDLRLVNGRRPCEGRVEVLRSGEWGTVCHYDWDEKDAAVVCRQMGCGYAIEAPGQARFGEGQGKIWRDNLQCEGNESDLTKCPAHDYGQEECTHRNDAGVICSLSLISCPDHLSLMLADGRGICDGRLEIFYNGSWGTVCDDSWDLANANVVCRQLQCKSPANATAPVSYGPGNGHIWLDDVHCKGNESSLLECGHQTWGQHNCRHKEDVGVHCSGKVITSIHPSIIQPAIYQLEGHRGLNYSSNHFKYSQKKLLKPKIHNIYCGDLKLFGNYKFKMLRLTDGCSGQLQVFYNNSWGSVCANDMDKSTAAMICKELDCDILNPSVKEGLSKLDPDPKWLDNVQCRGHEASIWQCPSSPWGKNTCTQKEVAELYCSGKINKYFFYIFCTLE